MIINSKIGWNLIKGYTRQKLKVKDLVAYSNSAGVNVTEQYNTVTINSIKSETKERVEVGCKIWLVKINITYLSFYNFEIIFSSLKKPVCTGLLG